MGCSFYDLFSCDRLCSPSPAEHFDATRCVMPAPCFPLLTTEVQNAQQFQSPTNGTVRVKMLGFWEAAIHTIVHNPISAEELWHSQF
jgi:hypothetical protein